MARERGIEHVSISAIAERAEVNRSTFYQYYADKETLLADALDVVAERAYGELRQGLVFTQEPPQVLVGFLSHIEEHGDLYRSVFTDPGWGVVLMRLRAKIHEAIVDVAGRDEVMAPRDVPLDVMAAGVAGSIVGVIGAWLRTDPRPSADVAALWAWQVILGPPPLPA